MVQKNIQLQNLAKKGDHLSSRLVQLSCQYDSSIRLVTEGRQLNAKSLMGILSFPFQEGMQLTVVADGADEADAVEAIAAYLG